MKNSAIILSTILSLSIAFTGCRQQTKTTDDSVSDLLGAESVATSDPANRDSVLSKYNELKTESARRRDTEFVFNPNELQTLVQKYTHLPLEEALVAIHKELMARHPGKIMEKYRFIFNDAGAALGQVAILYASVSEYLIFFGSPISTGGFSGRYPKVEFYDVMIAGEMTTVIEGQTKASVYRPGDMAHLAPGVAKGYRIDKSGWMLEYSRGSMISNFPFGVIGPALYITMDWRSAWNQIIDFLAAIKKSSGRSQ